MFALNGQGFNYVQFWYGQQDFANIGSKSYGGKTGIGYNGTTAASGQLWLGGGGTSQKCEGTISLSTATVKKAFVMEFEVAYSTLTNSLTEQDVLYMRSLDAGNSRSLAAKITAAYAGGSYTHKLYLQNLTENVSLSLGAIAGSTTYDKIVLHVFLDKVKSWVNGVAQTDLSLVTPEGTLPLYPDYVDLRWLDPAVCSPVFNWLRFGLQEVSYTTTIDKICINGKYPTGTLYAIEKTQLQGIITGDTKKIVVTDGAFTDTCTNNKDYLWVFVETGGTSGGAVKYNKSAGGVYTESNFTI